MLPLSPVLPSEFDSATVRTRNRLVRARRRAARRAAWWYPMAVAGCVLAGTWGLLKTDQYVADRLFWPTGGAQFIQVGQLPDDDATGGTIVVVAGGLNRKSGTGPALALMPALSADGARVFSLIYGSGINDRDIEDKFAGLLDRVRPERVDFFGSSMGGDVVLGLAQHLQHTRADYRSARQESRDTAPDERPSPAQVRAAAPAEPTARSRFAVLVTARVVGDDDPGAPPRLGVIYLDCTPLGAADVRDAGRTRADALTALSEALHTEGGVGLRMTAEVLAQQRQWSTGRFPFVDVRPDDLAFKVGQVWREKIDGPGIGTQLIMDQYGVIRRMDVDTVARDLGAGTRIVYFRPETSSDDRVVRVAAAEQTLRRLAVEVHLDVRIAAIPGGHHASAESNSDAYLAVLDAIRATRDT